MFFISWCMYIDTVFLIHIYSKPWCYTFSSVLNFTILFIKLTIVLIYLISNFSWHEYGYVGLLMNNDWRWLDVNYICWCSTWRCIRLHNCFQFNTYLSKHLTIILRYDYVFFLSFFFYIYIFVLNTFVTSFDDPPFCFLNY